MEEIITSRQNRLVKLIVSLRDKKNRDKTGLFWVEGERFVSSIPDTVEIKHIVVTDAERYADDPRAVCVTKEIFSYISDVDTPQGIGAVCVIPKEDSDLSGCGNIVYLDRVQNSDNLGAIIRSAACAGFDAVLLSEGCADCWSPKSIRSSAANVFNIKVMRSGPDGLRALKEEGRVICGSHLKGDTSFRPSPDERYVLIIGNEGNGMGEDTTALCDVLVKIPMRENCESLNASCAAAVLMYKIMGY